MSALDDAQLVHADDRARWRAWLEATHATSSGAWLVTWRRRAGGLGLDYEAAIEEALCFGWVDSTAGRVDDHRGKLYFAPRKPRSGWAATNKARIERLLAEGRMAPAGGAAIDRAQATGSWGGLDRAGRPLRPPRPPRTAPGFRPLPGSRSLPGLPSRCAPRRERIESVGSSTQPSGTCAREGRARARPGNMTRERSCVASDPARG